MRFLGFLAGAAIVAGGFAGTPARAAYTPLAFDFTIFCNASELGCAGNVTGVIAGLQNNATSTPTALYIDSYPGQVYEYDGPFIVNYEVPDGYDVMSCGYCINGAHNSFTVSNGQIVGADFSAGNDALNIGAPLYSINFNVGGFANFMADEYNYGPQGNYDGFGGIQYTAIDLPAPAPEPATWAMMIIGLGGVGALLRGSARREGAARASAAARP